MMKKSIKIVKSVSHMFINMLLNMIVEFLLNFYITYKELERDYG